MGSPCEPPTPRQQRIAAVEALDADTALGIDPDWRQAWSDARLQTAARLGRALDERLFIRPLGWSGFAELSLGGLLGALAPADLANCFPQHPDQAVHFISGHLHFERTPPADAGHFHAAANRPVAALYHPAPDRLPDAVPTHVVHSLPMMARISRGGRHAVKPAQTSGGRNPFPKPAA